MNLNKNIPKVLKSESTNKKINSFLKPDVVQVQIKPRKQYNSDDIHFCTADIGWVTGHSYIVYGPLLNAATTVMFEGIPTYPDAGRFWQIIEKQKVTHFYTAPTAIRSLMQSGTDFVYNSNLYP